MKGVIEKIELAIVAGRFGDAWNDLRVVLQKKIPREHILKIANLCRRTGHASVALRLLNPIIRPKDRRVKDDATDEERAEYAALLTYVGASEEAVQILESLDAQKISSVLLYRAFAMFNAWDYRGAIPLLQQYLNHPDLNPYQKIIGRVNLLAAYVDERMHADAEPMIAGLLNDTEESFKLLHGNILELSAQHYVLKKEWQPAEEFLERAEKKFAGARSLDNFLVKKWRVFHDFLKGQGDKASLKRLDDLRSEARSWWHWETIRDCDRVQAICLHDRQLFDKVFFGSPYESFRRRLVSDFSEKVIAPREYLLHWSYGPKAPRLDLLEGKWVPNGKSIKVGQILHRLLIEFTRDFYRPLRVAVIHHRLHPEEFYHPVSSPPRVYEAVRKLRTWFQRSKIPLDIVEHAGFYHLEPKGPMAIQIRSGEELGSGALTAVGKLKSQWKDQPFSVSQAAVFLGVSPRSALRLLSKALAESKELERTGTGPGTRYRVR